MTELIEQIKAELQAKAGDDLIAAINELREAIHQQSPFKSEPVDFVRWVKNSEVTERGGAREHAYL
jgi:hypothetical protein